MNIMVYAGRCYGFVKPRAPGSGIFDVIAKAANSALAKKVITSAVNKATNSNLAKKSCKFRNSKKSY